MTEPLFEKNIQKQFEPFMEEISSHAGDNLHSVFITGSALTTDYDPKHSDINSVLVLNRMDLNLLEWLAPLGKKFGKKRIAAPLIMTPDYVKKSLDVFPIEFLSIKLLHHCHQGEDIFNNLVIEKPDLRRQCERELKIRLIGLRQHFLQAAGDAGILTGEFIKSFSGYMPLFRGIISLMGGDPPILYSEVLGALEKSAGVNVDVFRQVLKQKKERGRFSISQLTDIFKGYYGVVQKLGDMVDDL
jgi:hypothetical protein